jgi:hypothetical protein
MKILSTLFLGLAICGYAMAQTSATGQASSATNASGAMQGTSASGQASTATSATAGVAGQAASANGQAQQTLQAELTKSIDAKKAKTGDKVEAKTIGAFKGAGDVNIPKGSKLIGHVTDAKPHAKGSEESTLGIVFDNAVLKGGQTVPLHALIMAAAAPRPVAVPSPDSGMDSGSNTGPSAPAGSSGGPLGRVGNTVGGVTGGVGNDVGGIASQTTGAVGGMGNDVGSTLGTQNTAGLNGGKVAGLPGVSLSSQGSNQTSGSVFRSSSQNVKLESGTTLLLKVATE